MSNYWQDRLIQELNDIYLTNTKSILTALSKLYLDTQKDIVRELVVLKQARSVSNIPSSREIVLQDTLTRVDKTLLVLADNSTNLMTKDLTNTYIQTYETVSDTLRSLGAQTIDILPANIEDIIKAPWSGVSFSDRIWHNKDVLIYNAKDIISKGLIRGESYHNMATELSATMGSSYSNAKRLVETEVQASQTKANVDNYINNGIEKAEISSILDKKICKHCNKHDGKIVNIRDAIIGVDLPPYHPYCRCTLLPYIDLD